MGFSTSKTDAQANGVHPARDAATHKRRVREDILSKYQSLRPDKSKSYPLDVSTLIIAKLKDREYEIVHLDATALLERIRARIYTCVEVINAHWKVAVAAQDFTNCLTEICINAACKRAKELDDYLERTGEVVGPLHGLPVSVKDHILVEGLDTSSGYTAWAENTIAETDAVVVSLLRKSGAIIYVKTANPQTLLSLETENHIFGRTVNPFNTTLSPGGSSGGEGALISSFGSPLGIGTDIGGSVVSSVPAAHCGLYGLKASVARMPHTGLRGSHDGMDNIVGVVGPIARSARDLALFCQAMLEAEAWTAEHQVLEMPWKPEVTEGHTLPARLTIAILEDDGVVRPHPPLIRALKKYRKALEAAGHEVIDWIPMKHQEAWDLIVKFYFLDGGEEYYETFEEGGEGPIATVAWILQHTKDRAPYTVRETWKLNVEREQFRAAALQHWNDTKHRTKSGQPVDAILTPTFPTLAPPHDTTRWWGYSSYWNLVDYPGVVFPTGEHLVAKDYPEGVDSLPAPRNDVEDFIRSQWDSKTYENAPISLQLVGRRHNEEKLLAILNKVEEATSRNVPP